MNVLNRFLSLNIRTVFTVALFSLLSDSLFSKTFTTTSSGSWNTASWSCTGGCSSATESPGNNIQGHSFIINHDLSSFPDVTFQSGTTNFELNANVTSTSFIKTQNQPVVNFTGSGTFIANKLFMQGGTFNSVIDMEFTGNVSITNSQTDFYISGNLKLGAALKIQDATAVFDGDIDGKNISAINSGAEVVINGDAKFSGTVTMNANNARIIGVGTIEFTGVNLTNGGEIDGDMDCNYDKDYFNTVSSPYFVDLATCSTVLPIELNYFTVLKSIEGFQFDWQTLTELNNDYFVIEYSRDLKNYTELVTVEGSGSSFDAIDYEYFSDDLFVNPEDEVIYFRLKQVDFDESFSYSLVVPVTIDQSLELGFSVYPNPTTDNVIVNIPINLSENDMVELSLINLLSNNTEVLSIETGEESTIDVAHLSSGVYLVRVEGITNPVKLVIQ